MAGIFQRSALCAFILSFAFTAHATSDPGSAGSAIASSGLEIKIEPVGISEEESSVLKKLILEDPTLKTRLQGSRFRVLRAQFGFEDEGRKTDENVNSARGGTLPYVMQIYDYSRDKLLWVSGQAGGSESRELKIEERASHSDSSQEPSPEPSVEELDDARELIQRDPRFAQFAGAYEVYPAMPPTVEDFEHPGERIIAVGIDPSRREGAEQGALKHEIVGVNLSRQTVIRYPNGAPPTAMANRAFCGWPSAGQNVTARGVEGQANITVSKNGETLWTFTVIRPSASSGRWGSGVDVKNVIYKGKRILSRMHTPILNVKYSGDACGPYRDWQYSENPFNAEGALLASGILRASAPPSTILQSGNDYGNFRGVAVYESEKETVLVSELSAGWYRYQAEYRFHEDGTIRPRWGLGSVRDSCTCNTHRHHIYWRFDFDVGATSANHVVYYDGASWKDQTTEARHYRDGSHQAWAVLDSIRTTGYMIVPGASDGTAAGDAFGKGDAWILRYGDYELEDSNVYAGASANLNAFVNGGSTTGSDVVVWYGAHFTHDPHGDSETDPAHFVGPTLQPFGSRNGALPAPPSAALTDLARTGPVPACR